MKSVKLIVGMLLALATFGSACKKEKKQVRHKDNLTATFDGHTVELVKIGYIINKQNKMVDFSGEYMINDSVQGSLRIGHCNLPENLIGVNIPMVRDTNCAYLLPTSLQTILINEIFRGTHEITVSENDSFSYIHFETFVNEPGYFNIKGYYRFKGVYTGGAWSADPQPPFKIVSGKFHFRTPGRYAD
jgi:hypothetical protein